MATSRSASAAARLSRSAAAAFRASGSGHHVPCTPSIRSDLAAAIVRPRALTLPNGNRIASSTLFSASCLNRVVSHPYSSAQRLRKSRQCCESNHISSSRTKRSKLYLKS